MQITINDEMGRRLKQAAIEARMSVEAFIERAISKILDKNKAATPETLKEFLHAMPIEKGDDFDQEVLKKHQADEQEKPAGTLDDLMKEFKVCP